MTPQHPVDVATDAAFLTREGGRFVPQPGARGAWGKTVGGHVIGGLLGWAAEHSGGEPGLRPARLTVDLPRATAMAPIELESRVLREGRRVRLVEVVATQQSKVCARATALFLRPGDQPQGQVWSPTTQLPPIPDVTAGTGPSFFARTYGWGAPVQNPDTDWPGDGGFKYAWLQITRPLIAGEPLTDFTRAAMAADVTAPIANWGTSGLEFINVDYTLTLSRLPTEVSIGLASQFHLSQDGIATGSATLVDRRGPFGSSVSVGLSHSGFSSGTAGDGVAQQ